MGSPHPALAITFGLLLAGLAVADPGLRDWSASVRLGVLLAGLVTAWLWFGAGQAARQGVLAAVLVVGASLLGAPTGGGLAVLLWLALAGVAIAGAAITGHRPGLGLTWLELIGAVVAVGVLVLSLAVRAFMGVQGLWPSLLQWLLYFMVWLALGRWLAGVAWAERRWLVGPAALIFGLACLAGGGTATAAAWQLHSAQADQASGDLTAAAARYGRARELAQRLRLDRLSEQAQLGLAVTLGRQGQAGAALAALEIPADGVVRMRPGEWEGPSGGLLFKNSSAWVDLWLWEGGVEVALRAWGQPARGEQPRLVVELAGKPVGQLEVSAAGPQTYLLRTVVPTGRHRLQISLANGLWTSGGEHRWAQLDSAWVRPVPEGEP